MKAHLWRRVLAQFKSFERGREKWQGAACEVIWFDEECPAEIYSEGVTRTNETWRDRGGAPLPP